jgi:hypothetical protein
MPRYTVTTDMLLYLSREVEASSAAEAEQLIRDEIVDLLSLDEIPVRVTHPSTLKADDGWKIGLYDAEGAIDPETVQASLSREDKE